MTNILDEVAKLIQSTSEAVKSVGESADKAITTALRGRFVQREGETDEAYQTRIQFLKEKHQKDKEEQSKQNEFRANQKLERQKIQEERRKNKANQKLELQKIKLEKQKLRRNSKTK